MTPLGHAMTADEFAVSAESFEKGRAGHVAPWCPA